VRVRHVVAALVLVAGCASPETVAPAIRCVEQPFRAELHVDIADDRKVWATHYESGRDVAIRPRPPGQFGFDPSRPTTLLNGRGEVVSFAGEILQTGCFEPFSGIVYIGPEDLPDPNRPPN